MWDVWLLDVCGWWWGGCCHQTDVRQQGCSSVILSPRFLFGCSWHFSSPWCSELWHVLLFYILFLGSFLLLPILSATLMCSPSSCCSCVSCVMMFLAKLNSVQWQFVCCRAIRCCSKYWSLLVGLWGRLQTQNSKLLGRKTKVQNNTCCKNSYTKTKHVHYIYIMGICVDFMNTLTLLSL